METNETHTHKPEYSQKTVTSQTGGSNADSLAQFELLKNMICGEVMDENIALKEKNEKLESERATDKETITRQANEITKLKNMLTHAQTLISTAEKCKETGDPRPMFNYEYDLSDHEMEASAKDIETFWDNNFQLTQIMMPDGTYLIDNAAAIVAVFLVYTKSLKLEKTKWHFIGTIINFCYCWNKNVVARIEDKERAAKLTCNSKALTAELNKAPWKKIGPARWRSEANGGSKHKKKLNRAANIKERIERMYA